MSDLIAYLVVALAGLFTIWRFLPKKLKRQAVPALTRLFGRRVSRKLENAGACGGCDSCKACDAPAKPDAQPLLFKK